MAARKQQSKTKQPKRSGARANPARAAGVGATVGRLAGKVAVITGGSRGIGLAVARALAAEGCNLVITGRDQVALGAAAVRVSESFPQLRGASAQAFPQVLPVTCDVRDADAVAALFAAVKRDFGSVDVLFNNAGVAQPVVSIENLSVETWRELIDTNLTGLFLCTRAALPLMTRGSTILNNLSVAAKRVFPEFSAYNSSKHGALGFTLSLREEVKQRGIRVTALMPGAIDTAIWGQFWPDAPRARMMATDTIAALILSVVLLPAEVNLTELVLDPVAGEL